MTKAAPSRAKPTTILVRFTLARALVGFVAEAAVAVAVSVHLKVFETYCDAVFLQRAGDRWWQFCGNAKRCLALFHQRKRE